MYSAHLLYDWLQLSMMSWRYFDALLMGGSHSAGISNGETETLQFLVAEQVIEQPSGGWKARTHPICIQRLVQPRTGPGPTQAVTKSKSITRLQIYPVVELSSNFFGVAIELLLSIVIMSCCMKTHQLSQP